MTQTYKIDAGGASPLRVFDSGGNVMFDANYAGIRITQQSYASLPANTAYFVSDTNAIADIVVAGDFDANPQVLGLQSGGYMASVGGAYMAPWMSAIYSIYGPYVWWDIAGFGTFSYLDGSTRKVRVANWSYSAATAHIAVLSNSVAG